MDDAQYYANLDTLPPADEGEYNPEERRERKKKKKKRTEDQDGEEDEEREKRRHHRRKHREQAEGENEEVPTEGDRSERRKKKRHRRQRDEPEENQPDDSQLEGDGEFTANLQYQPQEPDFEDNNGYPLTNGQYLNPEDEEDAHQEYANIEMYGDANIQRPPPPPPPQGYQPEFVDDNYPPDNNWPQDHVGEGYPQDEYPSPDNDGIFSFNEGHPGSNQGGSQLGGPMPAPEYIPPQESEPHKKKGGGSFASKLFSSFRGKGKKGKESYSSDDNQSGMHDGWSSNPQIFNPALDSQPATLDRPQPSRGNRNKIGGKSVRPLAAFKARVILLDGGEVEIDLDKKANGEELLTRLCVAMDIIEKDYFGLTYINRKVKTWFWIDTDKKIQKQLSHGEEWIFNFQVKFYPPEPTFIQEEITRYQLTLQLRQDVYTGKLPCSWITQALLGSFMVQSELGDYDEDMHGTGIDYVRELEFVQNQSDKLIEKIAELHKGHIGMTPEQADLKYLETAKRLEQYGIDLHPAMDMEDIRIYIGVCFHGVVIYRDRIKIGRFAWPKVLRISYKKNFFYLKIRSDYYDDVEALVGFKLFNHRLAKRLWKIAVEHHTFFRLKEPRMHGSGMSMPAFGGSKHRFSGRTFFQYRTMTINRQNTDFQRSLTTKRTASLPAGLNRAGFHYSSMHSLNRSHPRDMTLGKTQSVEYLGPRRYGSSTIPLNEMGTPNAPKGGVYTRENQDPFSTPIMPRQFQGSGSDIGGSHIQAEPPNVTAQYNGSVSGSDLGMRYPPRAGSDMGSSYAEDNDSQRAGVRVLPANPAPPKPAVKPRPQPPANRPPPAPRPQPVKQQRYAYPTQPEMNDQTDLDGPSPPQSLAGSGKFGVQVNMAEMGEEFL